MIHTCPRPAAEPMRELSSSHPDATRGTLTGSTRFPRQRLWYPGPLPSICPQPQLLGPGPQAAPRGNLSTPWGSPEPPIWPQWDRETSLGTDSTWLTPDPSPKVSRQPERYNPIRTTLPEWNPGPHLYAGSPWLPHPATPGSSRFHSHPHMALKYTQASDLSDPSCITAPLTLTSALWGLGGEQVLVSPFHRGGKLRHGSRSHDVRSS